MTRRLDRVLLLAAPALSLGVAAAQNTSPWTPLRGGGQVELAYTHQSADSLFAGETDAPLPADIELDSVNLLASYGLSDRIAVDVVVGYAESDFIVDPGLAPEGGLDGITDSFVGLRYKALDEIDGAPLTLTFGTGVTIAGDYDVGAISAIGDGASGAQVSVAAGRQLDRFSLSGDIGYRFRGEDVPDELFGSAQIGASLTDRLSAYGGYVFVEADGDLDIGGPGFTPARFPEVEENFQVWLVGAALGLTDTLSASVTYGDKFEGRNTAQSEFIRVGVAYGF